MLSLSLGVRTLFLSESKVRVSLEFTCIQPCTPAQLCLPSPHSLEASTHLLWHSLELTGSPRSLPAEWGQVQKTLLFLMFLSGNATSLCLQKQALEYSWMRQAHGQPQQTSSTEHARATVKAAQLSTSMVGQCYISMGLKYQETPGQKQGNVCFVSESYASLQKGNKSLEVMRELG